MILCPIAQFHRYLPLHPRFPRVESFLTCGAFDTLSEGRTELQGEDIYINSYPQACTRPAADAPLEAHRLYIDVQVVLAGTDTIGWSPLEACRTEAVPYDPIKDIVFFRDAPAALIAVTAGHLAIFFPEDAHAPLIGDGSSVKKQVIKVRV